MADEEKVIPEAESREEAEMKSCVSVSKKPSWKKPQ